MKEAETEAHRTGPSQGSNGHQAPSGHYLIDFTGDLWLEMTGSFTATLVVVDVATIGGCGLFGSEPLPAGAVEDEPVSLKAPQHDREKGNRRERAIDMADWLTRAWFQGAGDDNPEEAAKLARTRYVNSVHDSWPKGRGEQNPLMITVLDEICDMVDHETGYGTFTVDRIVERVSIGGPLTADQVRLALQHLLEDGCVVSYGNDLYQVPAAPDWTPVWKLRR